MDIVIAQRPFDVSVSTAATLDRRRSVTIMIPTDRAPTTFKPGDRLYFVQAGQMNGWLRGWRPAIEAGMTTRGLRVRAGTWHPCTIPARILHFDGWRLRWWDYSAERDPVL